MDKKDCFKPVTSQVKFKLLVDLVVQMKIEPRQGDFTQTFYQSTLQTNKKNWSPPHNCRITPKNT